MPCFDGKKEEKRKKAVNKCFVIYYENLQGRQGMMKSSKYHGLRKLYLQQQICLKLKKFEAFSGPFLVQSL